MLWRLAYRHKLFVVPMNTRHTLSCFGLFSVYQIDSRTHALKFFFQAFPDFSSKALHQAANTSGFFLFRSIGINDFLAAKRQTPASPSPFDQRSARGRIRLTRYPGNHQPGVERHRCIGGGCDDHGRCRGL